jgi:tetratricopeptide (TPR) repeat protein
MEASVRAQLQQARLALNQLLQDTTATESSQGAAYGVLGKLAMAFGIKNLATSAFENARSLDPGHFDWHYYLGVQHQQGLRFPQARLAFAACLEIRAGDLPTLVRLAQVAQKEGDQAQAGQIFGRLRDDLRGETPAIVHYGLGRSAAQAGDFHQAEQHFLRALEKQPEAREIRQRLGLAYRELGDLEKAREHLSIVVAGQLTFDDPLLDDLALLRSRGHVWSGMLASQEGRLEEAEEHYRLVVEAEPDSAAYRRALGSVLHRQGELAAAAEQYQKAVALDPVDAVARLRWADLLLELGGEEQEALAQLRQAVVIAPAYPEARLALGKVAIRQGGLDEAITHLQVAVDLQPEAVEARLRLGRALLDKGRVEEAIKYLQEALRLAPDQASLHLALGRAYDLTGRREESLAALRRTMDLAKDGSLAALAAHRIGLALASTGRLEAGAEHLGQALLWQPRMPDAYLALGRILSAQGRWAEAAVRLRQGWRLLPGEAELAHRLARLLATAPDPQLRDGAEAITLVEAALDLAASFAMAETRGMALATAGRLEEAAEWQRQLLAQAEDGRAPQPVLERLRRNLALYQSGRPYISSPPASHGEGQ